VSWRNFCCYNRLFSLIFRVLNVTLCGMTGWHLLIIYLFLILTYFYPLTLSAERYSYTWLHSVTDRHTESVGFLWKSDQPDEWSSTCTTQNIRETNFHVPGGFRTCNPRKRAAVDLRPRPRGHGDRHLLTHTYVILHSQWAKAKNQSNIPKQWSGIKQTYIQINKGLNNQSPINPIRTVA
jgi:hypothetical protein